MDALIATITAAVASHPGVAALVAFAAAVVEAVAVLGIIVPGTPILMATAAAVAAAGLPILPILVVAVLGAAIGDGLSYWLGSHHGAWIRATWPFRTRPRLMQRAETFFARFGSASVWLARFFPVLRSTVPLVAGMAGMPVRRFLAANLLSALVWAPVHVLPAQLVGLSIGSLAMAGLDTTDWRMLAVLLAALLAIAAAGWMVHRWSNQWIAGRMPPP